MSSNTNKANKALRPYVVIWTSERKKKHRIKLVSDEFLGDPPLILMANYTKIKIDKWQ